MRHRSKFTFAALLAALMLTGCGGGDGGGGASVAAGTVVDTGGNQARVAITVSAQQEVRAASADPGQPSGVPLSRMREAVVVGDHILVRSDSAATIQVDRDLIHPGTRVSALDAQGKFVATHDFGNTLASNYLGEWAMLPLAGGVVMVQTGAGSKLFRLDSQGAMAGAAAGIDLYAVQAVDSPLPTVVASAAAVDGDGFWYATTLVERPIPNSEKNAIYSMMLVKLDANGKEMTPPFKLTMSTKFLQPRMAVSGGSVLVTWLDSGTPMQAYWPYGGPRPVVHSVAGTGGGTPDLLPVAMASTGKVGMLWNYRVGMTSNLLGVALNDNGNPLIEAGRADLTQESLSASWKFARRDRVGFDARTAANGSLLIADVVTGRLNASDPLGDLLLLADYSYGAGPVSAATINVEYVRRDPAAAPLGQAPIVRQMLFADHAVLLIGDETHLETALVTRH
jgi:hypothetical protein